VFRLRRAANPPLTARTPPVEPDHAVRAAEEIVHHAWTRELQRRRDHRDLALHAAFQACDTAAARLAAAQRDGSPWKIGVARAAVTLAAQATDAAVLARNQARRALREQQRPPHRRRRTRSAAATARTQPQSGRPVMATWSPTASGPPQGRDQSAAPFSSPRRQLPSWLRRFGLRRATGPGPQ